MGRNQQQILAQLISTEVVASSVCGREQTLSNTFEVSPDKWHLSPCVSTKRSAGILVNGLDA
jgi:hypothetical protein